ncbi:unnamed protein product, partial [Staurois parvus]
PKPLHHCLADVAALLEQGGRLPTIHYSIHLDHPGLHGTHHLHVFFCPMQSFLLVSIGYWWPNRRFMHSCLYLHKPVCALNQPQIS